MDHVIQMTKDKDTKTTAVYKASGDEAVSVVYVNKSAFKDEKPTDTISLTVSIPD